VGGLFGAVLASMIYFIFVGVSAAVYATRKEKGGSKAILVIAGLANVVVFGFLSYQFLAYPAVWSLNNLTYGFIGLSIVAAAVIYLASKAYNSKRGIDISLAYKELPPE
jgi:hypothetical protein